MNKQNEQFNGENNQQKDVEKADNNLSEKIYNQYEAEKIIQEKRVLIENLCNRFKECNLFAELYKMVPDIDKMFFSNLPGKDKHIFHHALIGSNIVSSANSNIKEYNDYCYNEKDEEAEKFIKELLAIEDKNEFVERCKKIIKEAEEQRQENIRKKLDALNKVS